MRLGCVNTTAASDMTDRETFEQMLKEAGADYEVVSPGEMATTEITVQNWCANDEHDLGYICFYSCWFFNADGKLIGTGHWE